ncbi:F-box protein [Raphanus sativus]|uniref:F-box protein At5g51380-like n=1 Tax=Raphanus sativus TaxID=3726 RepID=A0A6J0KXB8_RAPSA|nr:F-box protein At5g51380-like [Raphanus sativus]KAJ4876774.1 F-box protein [Raphanus sativus]
MHNHHSRDSNSDIDFSSLLSDQLLLRVFSKLPISHHLTTSLVCKRWLFLHGRLVPSLKLLDWRFLESGRLFARFPLLTEIDTVPSSCILRHNAPNSGVLLTSKPSFSFSLPIHDDDLSPLDPDRIHQGLQLIAQNYPNLRRISLFGASEHALATLSSACRTLQELELHSCGDLSLKGVSGCANLQVMKLTARTTGGLYASSVMVSDIGLTILAQNCKRLVKLELSGGCEGSYDGVKAIGECCQMLEELTLQDHRMDGGWLAALSFCANLKTLKLRSCRAIDSDPGLDEHLGVCPMLQELHLERCHVRDTKSAKSLFLVCGRVREIVLRSCWGLRDDLFAFASVCRRVKLLYLEHCSLLTTGGLESVLLSWKGLERLTVVSCSKIKDKEVTPELASLFSVLKELKWRPDTRSLLSADLEGVGMWRKGGKFFTGLKG